MVWKICIHVLTTISFFQFQNKISLQNKQLRLLRIFQKESTIF